jgi:hypothetical protein
VQVSSTPTLTLFQSSGFSAFASPVMKHLPHIVRDFCPTIVNVSVDVSAAAAAAGPAKPPAGSRQKVDADLVRNECTQWLDRCVVCMYVCRYVCRYFV